MAVNQQWGSPATPGPPWGGRNDVYGQSAPATPGHMYAQSAPATPGPASVACRRCGKQHRPEMSGDEYCLHCHRNVGHNGHGPKRRCSANCCGSWQSAQHQPFCSERCQTFGVELKPCAANGCEGSQSVILQPFCGHRCKKFGVRPRACAAPLCPKNQTVPHAPYCHASCKAATDAAEALRSLPAQLAVSQTKHDKLVRTVEILQGLVGGIEERLASATTRLSANDVSLAAVRLDHEKCDAEVRASFEERIASMDARQAFAMEELSERAADTERVLAVLRFADVASAPPSTGDDASADADGEVEGCKQQFAIYTTRGDTAASGPTGLDAFREEQLAGVDARQSSAAEQRRGETHDVASLLAALEERLVQAETAASSARDIALAAMHRDPEKCDDKLSVFLEVKPEEKLRSGPPDSTEERSEHTLDTKKRLASIEERLARTLAAVSAQDDAVAAVCVDLKRCNAQVSACLEEQSAGLDKHARSSLLSEDGSEHAQDTSEKQFSGMEERLAEVMDAAVERSRQDRSVEETLFARTDERLANVTAALSTHDAALVAMRSDFERCDAEERARFEEQLASLSRELSQHVRDATEQFADMQGRVAGVAALYARELSFPPAQLAERQSSSEENLASVDIRQMPTTEDDLSEHQQHTAKQFADVEERLVVATAILSTHDAALSSLPRDIEKCNAEVRACFEEVIRAKEDSSAHARDAAKSIAGMEERLSDLTALLSTHDVKLSSLPFDLGELRGCFEERLDSVDARQTAIMDTVTVHSKDTAKRFAVVEERLGRSTTTTSWAAPPAKNVALPPMRGDLDRCDTDNAAERSPRISGAPPPPQENQRGATGATTLGPSTRPHVIPDHRTPRISGAPPPLQDQTSTRPHVTPDHRGAAVGATIPVPAIGHPVAPGAGTPSRASGAPPAGAEPEHELAQYSDSL